MRKIIWICMSVCLAVVLARYSNLNLEPTEGKLTQLQSETAQAPVTKVRRLSSVNSPEKWQSSLPSVDRSRCTESLNQLVEVSVQEKDLFVEKIGDVPAFCLKDSPQVNLALKLAARHCQEADSEPCKNSKLILTSIQLSKPFVESTADMKISPKEARARVIASLFSFSNGLEGAGQFALAAKQLSEIDQNSSYAAKLLPTAQMTEWYAEGLTEPRDGWASAEESIERAIRLNPDDPSLEKMALIAQTHGMQPDLLREKLRGLEKKTQTSETLIIRAFAEWKLGEHKESKDLVRQALALDPANPELSLLFARINSPEANSESFQLSWNTAIVLTDLSEGIGG